jgi:hypothetical protein
MKLQTKCTWVIVGLFIIEILPVPVTSLYSLYAIRKRPAWLPVVTQGLYAETPDQSDDSHQPPITSDDPMQVRKNCTIGLVIMFIVDLLIPIVIPTALYVVRRRPKWFKNLITRLYTDQISYLSLPSYENTEYRSQDPFILARAEQKMADLEQKNLSFAKSQTRRQHR